MNHPAVRLIGPLAGLALALIVVLGMLAVTMAQAPHQWGTDEERWMARECPVRTQSDDDGERYTQAVLRVRESPAVHWWVHDEREDVAREASAVLPAGNLVCVSWRSMKRLPTDPDGKTALFAVAWWPQQPYQSQYVCVAGPGCTPVLPDTVVGGVSDSADGSAALTLDARFTSASP